MTSAQGYPTLPGTSDLEQMGHEATAVGVGGEWYATNSYAYQASYTTSHPSSTVEGQPWTQCARASGPDVNIAGYAVRQPVQQLHDQPQQSFKDPGRPRSSPSTFGPSADAISWPTMTAPGIHGMPYTTTTGSHAAPAVTSAFPPNVFQTYPLIEEHYPTGTSSPPEICQPQPRRPHTSVAPPPSLSLPEQQQLSKRKRDEEQLTTPEESGKRRKRTSYVASADLNEDDKFLVQLKEEESLPWKDIATRFQSDKGKTFQVAALQMRYKRLREKFRIWEEGDVQALRMAYEYWDKYKWEIISAKMLDFGLTERWPARHCARKWQDLELGLSTSSSSSNPNHSATTLTTSSMTTTTTTTTTASRSQFSSPEEGPLHFGFMPMH